MADQHQHQQDEVRDSILTRLEMLLNDVTAAISPDPEPHIIDHIFLIALKLFIDVLLFSLHKILIRTADI